MNLTVAYNEQESIVQVNMGGSVSTAQLDEESDIRSTGEIADQNNCKSILLDAREATVGQSLMAGYDGAKSFGEHTGMDETHKCAVIIDPEKYPMERAKFLEAVTENWDNNPTLKVFDQYDSAIKWLRN